MQESRSHRRAQIPSYFFSRDRLRMALEIVDCVNELSKQMLPHPSVFGLRVDDGCLLLFARWTSWINGISWRGGVDGNGFWGWWLKTDDCTGENGLRLCALLEGRKLGIKGGHGGPRGESKGQSQRKYRNYGNSLFCKYFCNFCKVETITLAAVADRLFIYPISSSHLRLMLRPILVNPLATTVAEAQTENSKAIAGTAEKKKVHFPQQGISETN